MWKRGRYHLALGSALLALCGLAGAQEGEWRWRLVASEDQLSLYTASTDGGTDDTGSPSLSCDKGSKHVRVRGTMSDKLKRALADAIVNDVYPVVEPVPDGEGGGALLEPAFGDMNGWTYAFDMSVDAKAFEPFRRTGIFSFKFNGVLIEDGEPKGVERIAEFQESCKRGAW